MKSHWINIYYDFEWDDPNIGKVFSGLVTGLEINGKVWIDPVKLYRNAFKAEMPGRATITYG